MKLKKLFYFGFIGLLLGNSAFCVEYDDDYERAYKAGKAKNLTHYVQQLATPDQNDQPDDSDTMLRKSEALKYFFATGGKHGFRKEPATKEELKILTNALIITTLYHEELNKKNPEAFLNLLEIRRSYNQDQDSSLNDHFITAQTIIAQTSFTVIVLENYEKLGSYMESLYALKTKNQELVSNDWIFFNKIKSDYQNNYLKIMQKLSVKSENDWLSTFMDRTDTAITNTIIDRINFLTNSSNDQLENIENNEIVQIKGALEYIINTDLNPTSQSNNKAKKSYSIEQQKLKEDFENIEGWKKYYEKENFSIRLVAAGAGGSQDYYRPIEYNLKNNKKIQYFLNAYVQVKKKKNIMDLLQEVLDRTTDPRDTRSPVTEESIKELEFGSGFGYAIKIFDYLITKENQEIREKVLETVLKNAH